MPQYIPLTNNCDLPCLAIDSHAPLADLHNNALLRIRGKRTTNPTFKAANRSLMLRSRSLSGASHHDASRRQS